MCQKARHPVDALNEIAAKIAFLGDIFSVQIEQKPAAMSSAGAFGLFLILRGLEDEVTSVENQLHNKEEVRS